MLKNHQNNQKHAFGCPKASKMHFGDQKAYFWVPQKYQNGILGTKKHTFWVSKTIKSMVLGTQKYQKCHFSTLGG